MLITCPEIMTLSLSRLGKQITEVVSTLKTCGVRVALIGGLALHKLDSSCKGG